MSMKGIYLITERDSYKNFVKSWNVHNLGVFSPLISNTKLLGLYPSAQMDIYLGDIQHSTGVVSKLGH